MKEELDTGTTSIHVTSDDVKLLEKHDLSNKQISKAYHTSVYEMDKYRQLRESKKDEIREKLIKLKNEASKFEIDLQFTLNDSKRNDTNIIDF
jgi:hypothetical protein